MQAPHQRRPTSLLLSTWKPLRSSLSRTMQGGSLMKYSQKWFPKTLLFEAPRYHISSGAERPSPTGVGPTSVWIWALLSGRGMVHESRSGSHPGLWAQCGCQPLRCQACCDPRPRVQFLQLSGLGFLMLHETSLLMTYGLGLEGRASIYLSKRL